MNDQRMQIIEIFVVFEICRQFFNFCVFQGSEIFVCETFLWNSMVVYGFWVIKSKKLLRDFFEDQHGKLHSFEIVQRS